MFSNTGDPHGSQPAALAPAGVLGKISAVQKQIVFNELQSKLSLHFELVSQEKFLRAQEAVFATLDISECTEEQCIRKIQEALQVENILVLQMLRDGPDTQLSLTLVALDNRVVETQYCENCNTRALNHRVAGMVENLIRKR